MHVIAALATPMGRSAIAVVRLSGPGLQGVLERILRPFAGWPIPPGRSRRVELLDREGVFDDGVAVLGRAPRTVTGEDVAEIGCHGNPIVVERLLRAAVDAGARLAEPGEFTRRALENGRIDLLGAEAVLQVTRAQSADGVRIGRDGLDGRLAAHFAHARRALVEVAADVEARLDYPADDLAYHGDAHLLAELGRVAQDCRGLAATHAAARVLVDGARVALVGPVNAGKSSLFNALLGRRRALVHEEPGTTRDVLEVQVTLAGVPVTLLDTAGERDTADPVEAAGLALARELVAEADLLVVVLRAAARSGPVARAILRRTAERPRIVVWSAVDEVKCRVPRGVIATSATEGRGIEALKAAIARELGAAPSTGAERLMIASARQHERLLAIAEACEEAADALPEAGPAVAADAVTRALLAIDALTGADTREDVLDALFARFCIGK